MRRFFLSGKGTSFEVCGSKEKLNVFMDFIEETNSKLFPRFLSIDRIKELAKDKGLKVINEEER